jgi:hypothetical protein
MSFQNLLGGAGLPPPPPQPKRNVFISSFHADQAEVDSFIYNCTKVAKIFTAKALGTFDNEDFIDSDNPEYVMSQIREKYIGDASITIVLVGKCTHSRRYVDWEIKSSLRRGQSLPNGLLAYVLPSATPPPGEPRWSRKWPHVPPRLAANWNYEHQDLCYARYYEMPPSTDDVRRNVEAAFLDRTNRADLIKNGSDMMKNNAKCNVCGVWH